MQRTFNEVVRSISRAERDVDRVLKAARLQRSELTPVDRIRFDNAIATIENTVIFLTSMGFMGFMFWLMMNAGR